MFEQCVRRLRCGNKKWWQELMSSVFRKLAAPVTHQHDATPQSIFSVYCAHFGPCGGFGRGGRGAPAPAPGRPARPLGVELGATLCLTLCDVEEDVGSTSTSPDRIVCSRRSTGFKNRLRQLAALFTGGCSSSGLGACAACAPPGVSAPALLAYTLASCFPSLGQLKQHQ